MKDRLVELFSSRYGKALLLFLLAFLLLLSSTLLPWYVWNREWDSSDGHNRYTTTEDLWEMKDEWSTYDHHGDPDEGEDSESWASMEDDWGEELAQVYSKQLTLALISLVPALLAFLFLLAGQRKPSFGPGSRKLGLFFAVLTIVLIIIAALLFMVQLPSAHEKEVGEEGVDGPWDSFMGWSTDGDDSSQWYPSSGWFAQIVSGFLYGAGSTLLFVEIKKTGREPEDESSEFTPSLYRE